MTDIVKLALMNPETAPMSMAEIVAEEIREFKASDEYAHMLDGEAYYRNRSSVQGKTVDIQNRSNSRIEHPILKKLVDQKTNYLLANPFTIETDSAEYSDALQSIFNAELRRKIKSLGKHAVMHGIAYLQPYIDGGEIRFIRIPATEVVPHWEDAEKQKLHSFTRFYEQIVYEGRRKKTITKAEFWSTEGVQYFESNDGRKFVQTGDEPHIRKDNSFYNWGDTPLIWCRYNEEALPLAYFVKDLIDDINWQTSVTADVLRDVAKFIYILRGYGGQDLDRFIKELRDSLAIKVDSDGGVDKLQADISVESVMQLLDKQRRDVYDFASGVDTQDKELGNSSGTAINFRYMALDADCASLGSEMKAAFERMKRFIDTYLVMSGQGDFAKDTFEIVFNADMPVNETDIIQNARNSQGIISTRTILSNHPWVVDVDTELEQLKMEQEEAMERFGEGMFERINDEQGILDQAGNASRGSGE